MLLTANDYGSWATVYELVPGVTENTPTADLDTFSVAISHGNEVNGRLFARLIAIKP